MFLEIKGIKKHFGEGDSRIEVLKGKDSRYGRKDADIVQKKASRLCLSDV